MMRRDAGEVCKNGTVRRNHGGEKEAFSMNGNLAYKLEPKEEIVGGRVVMMAPATVNHGRVCGNIYGIFRNYLIGRRCEPFPDGVGLCLEEDAEEYQPDGMVVCDPEKVKARGVVGAPDLVVEVLSPSTAKNDRGHKMNAYEKHGVREYWIVSPDALTLEQYVLEDGRFVLRDVYHRYTAAELADMKEKERADVVMEFQCSLFADLTIRLEDVFGRVVVG